MRLFIAATVVARTVFTLTSGLAQAASSGGSGGATPTVALTKVIMQVPAGIQMHILQQGVFCGQTGSEKSDGRVMPFNLSVFGPAFSRNFETPNAIVAGSRSTSLFF